MSIKNDINEHLATNIDAKSAMLKLALAVAASIAGAIAPLIIEHSAEIQALLQAVLPASVYAFVAPVLLIVLNAIAAWLASSGRSQAKKGVVNALATPTPKSLESYYK